MGSNQLFIIVFAGDAYIYIIGYQVFSELLLSPCPPYVKTQYIQNKLIIIGVKAIHISWFHYFHSFTEEVL